MKQKRVWHLYIAIILLAGFLLLAWFASTARINEESYKRIANGMSRREVEQIFRAGPGDHGSGELSMRWLDPDPDRQDWLGDRIGIGIYFSADEKVVGKVIFPINREKRWYHRVRDWFTKRTPQVDD